MFTPVRLRKNNVESTHTVFTNLNADNRVVKLKKKYLNARMYNIYGLIRRVPSVYQRPPLPPTFNSKFWIKTPPLYHYVSDSDIHEQFCGHVVDDPHAGSDMVANNYLYTSTDLSQSITLDENENNASLPVLSHSLSSFSASEIVKDTPKKEASISSSSSSSTSSSSLEELNQSKPAGKSLSNSSTECPYSTFNLIKNEHSSVNPYDNCQLILSVPVHSQEPVQDPEDYSLSGQDRHYVDFERLYREMCAQQHHEMHTRDSLSEEDLKAMMNHYEESPDDQAWVILFSNSI